MKKAPLHVMIDETLKKKAKRIAKREYMTVTAFIASLIRKAK